MSEDVVRAIVEKQETNECNDYIFIKHCASCGQFLRKDRWMIVGGYDYKMNRRPICWDCDASYE